MTPMPGTRLMPPSATRTAFVTGGTGFVGLNLVKELMIRGWDVTALHRPSSDLKLLKRFRPKLSVGELTDPAALLAAVPDGTATVFHVAGNTNMWRGGNAEQTRDNVEGTRNVVNAALAKGVRRLIVTSSISAYGMVSGEIDEHTPSVAANSSVSYQKTKWEAQQIALAALQKGLEVVIMQPGAIMGPYDIGTWSRLFLMVRDDKLPGVPASMLTFAHVREVVAAHIAAAEKGQNGGSYLLGGENRSMLDLVREIAVLVGKPVPTKVVPTGILRIAATLGDLASRITGKPPAITPEMVQTISKSVSTSSAKAARELGYRVVPLKDMVKDCYDWMVAEGRI
jgi:dihydroflavonol-4-reductase